MIRFIQLLGILILIALLFAIGTISMPGDYDSQPPPVVVVPTYDSFDETLYYTPDSRSAIVEYGAVNVILNNGSLTNPTENHFHAYIAFPQSGHSTDEVIYSWANELYYTMSTEFAAVRSIDPSAIGEVNVNFDTYLIDNRYVGVLFHGAYAFELTPDFYNLIQTFNIDLSREIFLEASDIFDPLLIDDVLSLLVEAITERYPDAAFYTDSADESWLTHVVLSHRGVIVYLPQNEFLPEYFPTINIFLDYRDIGAALLIRNQPPLDAPPIPTFDAEPITIVPDAVESDDDYDDGELDLIEDTDDLDDFDELLFIPDVDPQRPIIEATRPIIAMSFNAAPGSAYFNRLLDLFERYNVRGTFSVPGNLVSIDQSSLVRASLNGNEIIGQSWNHRNLAKLSEDEVRRQILDTAEAIRSVTGISSNLFRTPFGEVNDLIRSVSSDLGFTIVNWNLDTMDWRYEDADTIIYNVLESIQDRDIILSHANYATTLEVYTRLIPILISNGFQFVTVSELFQWSQIIIEPGEVVFSG